MIYILVCVFEAPFTAFQPARTCGHLWAYVWPNLAPLFGLVGAAMQDAGQQCYPILLTADNYDVWYRCSHKRLLSKRALLDPFFGAVVNRQLIDRQNNRTKARHCAMNHFKKTPYFHLDVPGTAVVGLLPFKTGAFRNST